MTRRRKLWLAAALGAVLSTILIVAPAPASTGRSDPAASAAVTALVRTGRAAVPDGFAAVMGYTPVTATLADGEVRTINPNGSCSVPGQGRPFAFATACKAHDFGYDLLRYAERRGEPLGVEARTAIDSRLVADLRTQCEQTTTGSEYAGCQATVDVFAAGVGFNSWRQMSGPPVDTAGLVRTAGLVLLGLLLITFPARRRVRRVWRRTRKILIYQRATATA
ncbi:phospholipase A2 [Hamadaea sp. NPDC050747]|uniref:phospholipase A2 n=1 Tax=Hamadaea sp. NPDC050747 TaxID=3155789 RepID=UPI003404DFDA